MIVKPIVTDRIEVGDSLLEVIEKNVKQLGEGSVLAITSKIISICEKRVVKVGTISKEELVRSEADLYFNNAKGPYRNTYTIARNTLIGSSGIDESNGDGYYILWPKDCFATSTQVRDYLKSRFNLKKVGVLIVDSASMPFRLGSNGIAIGFAGFVPINNYVGKPDLYGRKFKISKSNIAGGLAAAAVVAMGEGSEKTPLAIIEDVPFVEFVDHNPTDTDLEGFRITIEGDLFGTIFESIDWQKGGN